METSLSYNQRRHVPTIGRERERERERERVVTSIGKEIATICYAIMCSFGNISYERGNEGEGNESKLSFTWRLLQLYQQACIVALPGPLCLAAHQSALILFFNSFQNNPRWGRERLTTIPLMSYRRSLTPSVILEEEKRAKRID
jgi:hypothetical protein